MTKDRKGVSAHHPFPIVKKRDRKDVFLERLDSERSKLHKDYNPPEKKQSISELYFNSELGQQRHKWLKENGWVKLIGENPEVLVSYRKKSTKLKIRVLKDGKVKQIGVPESPEVFDSWASFVSSTKLLQEDV